MNPSFRLGNARRREKNNNTVAVNRRSSRASRRKCLGLSFAALILVLALLSSFLSPSATGPSIISSLSILEIDAAAKTNLQERNKKDECSFLEQLCSTPGQLIIQMAAVPHTASSSTDRLFAAAQKTWNVSAAIPDMGFSFQGEEEMVRFSPNRCPNVPECVLSKLRYRNSIHAPYDKAKQRADIVFTILREPEQFVLSQYRMRKYWDNKWELEYPNGPNATNIRPSEWAAKNWWRHNLFTKMLATDTRMIWAGNSKFFKTGNPTKQESDKENSLGKDSAWLQVARQQLLDMPFFGLMHRLNESFELMGFHFCFSVVAKQDPKKDPRMVDPVLKKVVQKHFVLDTILLREAEKIFDGLVQDMRHKKEQGILCDLGNVLKSPELEMGFKCLK